MIRAHTHSRVVERKYLLWVALLTSVFFGAEVAGGLISHSLALLADAGHLLTDLAAIGLAMVAFWYSGKAATERRTFGYLRAEILSGLLNGVTLVLISLYIVFEGVRRISTLPEIDGALMLGVAAAGLVANVVGAVLLHKMAKRNLNVQGVFVHLLGDGLSSVAVLVSGIIIILTGWDLVDPAIALFIALIILFSAWRLIRSTVDVLIEAVPSRLSLACIRGAMSETEGVQSVHDLHVWTLTSGCVAMSAHVRLKDPSDGREVLLSLREKLKKEHGIDHLTLQLERADIPDEEVHIIGDPRCLA